MTGKSVEGGGPIDQACALWAGAPGGLPKNYKGDFFLIFLAILANFYRISLIFKGNSWYFDTLFDHLSIYHSDLVTFTLCRAGLEPECNQTYQGWSNKVSKYQELPLKICEMP